MAKTHMKVSVSNLAVGMNVARLDCPWEDTPFEVQGFEIKSVDEIHVLQMHCDHVYVEVDKIGLPAEDSGKTPGKAAAGAKSRAKSNRPKARIIAQPAQPITIRKGLYETTVALRDEIENARTIARNLRGNLSIVTRQISRGKLTDYQKLVDNVSDMVGSILVCPDAFTWLMRLRDKDQQAHDHTLRTALWAVQFARYIGISQDEIKALCLACLLKDVGKTRVSNVVLRKPHRDEEEEAEYQSFVEHGVEMLRNTGQIEPRIISIVRYQAERNDGSGFPEGVSGNRIPLLARIVGIAATYDTISNPRESGQPVALSRAVSMLYNMKGTEFQEDLVLAFIQSVGLYPPGTLVELTTGDIGVVIEQHPKSRLAPQIAVLDQNADDLNKDIFMVDLKDPELTRKTLAKHGRVDLKSGDKIAIARDLEPTGYDIDMPKVAGLFLDGKIEKKTSVWQSLAARLGL